MDEIVVEGFRVMIERSEKGFTLTVPELPGVVGQVENEKDAAAEMRRLIAVHLGELAGKKPKKKDDNGDLGNTKTHRARR